MAVKCPKCHSENPDTLKFCGECGTQLVRRHIPDSPESGEYPKNSRGFRPEVTETLLAPVQELTTGSTFAGRCQIIEELGKGGMGKVYRALDKKLKEEVALKLIKKTGNIMIDKDGNARIMDFGIARSLAGKGITGAGA